MKQQQVLMLNAELDGYRTTHTLSRSIERPSAANVT